ncbi:MAG: FKBP-type peptidyl-prolyl cis-trans isomerase [Myxococcota bacterium]|nr:FKBP-type peptidyl-prolyl cis-trans isomerase [Myxococcota bacterium]
MIRPLFFTSLLALLLSTAASAETPPEISKKDFSYSFGILIGKSMLSQGLESGSLDEKVFLNALQNTLDGKELKWDDQQAQMYVMMTIQALQAKQAEKFSKEHKKFFDKNAKKKGVVSLPSGVQYTILKDGDGESVKAEDTIQVHYTGSLADGTIFDSSVARNQPATLGVNQVIPGWQEILPKMKVGSKWKVFIPPDLGYGASGAGSIPPHSILVFEIEVLGIEK